MDRVIETDPFKRFRPGDRVAHISAGDGVVVSSQPGVVQVQFQNFVGKYDKLWFDLHPSYLFHRGTEPLRN